MLNKGLGLLIVATVAAPNKANADEWSGPYVGVFGEATHSQTDFEDMGCWYVCTKPTTQGVTATGGGTVGVDFQVADSFAFGVAGDISGGIDRQTIIGDRNAPAHATVVLKSKTSLQASIRARAGLVTGDTMVYATGGVSIAKARFVAEAHNFVVMAAYPDNNPSYSATWEGTTSGMVFGGGIEHRINNFSARFEIIHSKFGRKTACNANSDGPDAGQCWERVDYIPSVVATDLSTTSIRLGMNWRL